MDILVSREKLSFLFSLAERTSLHTAIIRNKYCSKPMLLNMYSREHPRDRAVINVSYARKMAFRDKWAFDGMWTGGFCPITYERKLPEFRDYAGTVTMEAPCRKCDGCYRVKRWEWTSRSAIEMRRSPRTWMATFTYSPQQHFFCKLRAGKKTHERQVARDVALFFKRLRKNLKQPFAFMYVLERHKSGLPHVHALIHERSLRGLRKAELQENWSYGFTTFKLIEHENGVSAQRAARYVVKYLQKEQEGRVRASLRYGKPLL